MEHDGQARPSPSPVLSSTKGPSIYCGRSPVHSRKPLGAPLLECRNLNQVLTYYNGADICQEQCSC